MDTTTRMLIEQIGRLGYRVAIARDHVVRGYSRFELSAAFC